MSKRQIELQVIIKNHENKIMLLKEESKLLTARYEEKIKNLQEEQTRIIAEKDKVIHYLELEMQKNRELIYYEQELFDSRKNKEREELVKDLECYKSKCFELERRIQSITEKYQIRHKELQEENSNLKDANEMGNTSRFSMQTQIQKLNKFYQTSRVVNPQRNQTLEWVDKLTAFIGRFESETTKGTKETMSLLKINIQNLKCELISSLKHANDQQQIFAGEIKQTLQKIKSIIEQQNKINGQLAEDNERFWQSIKKQKNTQNLQKINELEKEMINTKKKYQEELEDFTNKVKHLQRERKTLLLGFTELKTLNQAREKIYRDQIVTLKQSIEELLAGIEQREIQFQKQTQTLHAQLTTISDRYYENIEIPLHKISSRLEIEVKAARNELQKLVDNKGFIKLLQNLQKTLQNYVNEQANSTKLAHDLAQYNKKTAQLAAISQELIHMETQRQLFQSQQKNLGFLPQEKEMVLQNCISDLQWRERQNKLNYELNLLKRQNKQLKDQFSTTESKAKNDRSTSTLKKQSAQKRPDERQTNIKIIELQSEVEQLKKLNNGYKQEFMYQIKIIRQALFKSIGKEPKDLSNFSRVHEGITSVNCFNQDIRSFLQQEKDHIRAVRDTLSSLDRMLVKPVQIFDQFVKKLSDCHNPFIIPTNNNKNTAKSNVLNVQKLQQFYNEITIRRQDNTNSVTKLILELIRVVRESQPLGMKNKVIQEGKFQKKEENLKNSRINIKDKSIEKKVKELQTLRIKNRQEMVRKIQKIEENLRTVDQKISKKAIPNVAKVQQLLDKKLTELSEKIINKSDDSSSQLGSITTSALKDLKAKLKACMSDNEGLLRQLQCLQTLRKT